MATIHSFMDFRTLMFASLSRLSCILRLFLAASPTMPFVPAMNSVMMRLKPEPIASGIGVVASPACVAKGLECSAYCEAAQRQKYDGGCNCSHFLSPILEANQRSAALLVIAIPRWDCLSFYLPRRMPGLRARSEARFFQISATRHIAERRLPGCRLPQY